MASLAAAGATFASGWTREATAGGFGFGAGCGQGAHDIEEEFLDLRRADGGETEELSHFFSDRANVTADERFRVAQEGQTLAYLGDGGFRVRSGNEPAHEVPAPNGGRIVPSATSLAFALQLYTLSPYDQVVLANPRTGAHELWDDAFAANGLVSSAWGFVLGHGDARGGGRLSLITGERQTRELARTEATPTHVCTSAARVAYFVDDRAFTLDLARPDEPPRKIGRLAKPPTFAALQGSNLVATTTDGVFVFTDAGAFRRLATLQDPTFLFAQRGKIVVAAKDRIVIHQAGRSHTVDAPNENLHFAAPIEGSDDLIVCRGRSVLRYRANRHQLETIGRGREGMKLRGAALTADRLLTWSSRTWRLVDGGCRPLLPPRAYLID